MTPNTNNPNAKDKWNESDMIMRWPPEFLEIVGKHSKHWKHSKSETLLILDEWLEAHTTTKIREAMEFVIGDDEKIKDVKNRNILDTPKVKIQNLYRADRNMLRGSQRQRLEQYLKQL